MVNTQPIKTVMGMVYGIELGLPHEWEWMIPWEYDVIICDIYIYMVHIYGDKRNTRDDDG
jgi:cation transport regulator ChaB